MSKLVELYVMELTKEGSTMTINDVPKRLRDQVAAAISAQAADTTYTGETGAVE